MTQKLIIFINPVYPYIIIIIMSCHAAPANDAFCFYLPKRLTKSPTEKDPKMPPMEKTETEMDHSVVRRVAGIDVEYRSNQVSL